MRNLERKTAPATGDEGPVTLAELKSHGRIVTDTHDDLLQDCLDAAIGQCDGPEGALNRAIGSQTWVWRLRDFPGCRFELPLPRLQAVNSIKYRDADDVLQTVSSDLYRVHVNRPVGVVELVSGASWPSVPVDRLDAIEIDYDCGYADAAAVPAGLKRAILQFALHLYRQPEPLVVGTIVTKVPNTLEALLASYVVH